jgi:hypothetical protein
MKSPERPHDSSTFDALWGSPEGEDEEEDDDGLPAALAPSRKARVPEQDRETLLPPLPPGEYVQAMMALGELDDPMDIAPRVTMGA